MKDTFGKNLKKMRQLNGWTQERAAMEIGIGRPAYAAWEEGRSFPCQEDLIKVARVHMISDLIGFIDNEHFDPKDQSSSSVVSDKAAAELYRNYKSTDVKTRLAVNILLGLVNLQD